nr:hypothetical protein Itr_chr06CG19040 [Ipomoea trifida]
MVVQDEQARMIVSTHDNRSDLVSYVMRAGQGNRVTLGGGGAKKDGVTCRHCTAPGMIQANVFNSLDTLTGWVLDHDPMVEVQVGAHNNRLDEEKVQEQESM